MLSCEPLLEDLGRFDLTDIHWVIVGGESGGNARELDIQWVDSIIQQCRAAGVPVFTKQLGAKPVGPDGPFRIVGQDGKLDRKGKTIEAWPARLRVREFPSSMSSAVQEPTEDPGRSAIGDCASSQQAFETNPMSPRGQRISGEGRRLREEVLRFPSGRNPAAKRRPYTPEQFALMQTLGNTLLFFSTGATDEDLNASHELQGALADFFADQGLPEQHIGLALTGILLNVVAKTSGSI